MKIYETTSKANTRGTYIDHHRMQLLLNSTSLLVFLFVALSVIFFKFHRIYSVCWDNKQIHYKLNMSIDAVMNQEFTLPHIICFGFFFYYFAIVFIPFFLLLSISNLSINSLFVYFVWISGFRIFVTVSLIKNAFVHSEWFGQK